MEEVERLCDRIILLKDGRSRLYGTVEEIRQQYGVQVVDVEFTGEFPKKHASFTVKQLGKRSAELQPAGKATPQDILQELIGHAHLGITTFHLRQSSLDDIFVSIYQEGTTAEVSA
jgi:ABC-2 type transport system ATP-binding protein